MLCYSYPAVDGVWNAWTAWNECSHTCGYGNRNRSRTCRGPFHDGAECPGLPDDVETCNAFSCPGKYGFHFDAN
ncbi:hypothetical protein DPMN_008711 [Dreissena polymorpha]|uniref:Uncharacterized protein n=1 Tax=Dreissena polymorpha TaxID=45954 RepID=A0A9D4MYZ0_DREPO|nr:hypothetical protein DPMN_008711 [Dreissena polymorpha]